jgi:predicted helicase
MAPYAVAHLKLGMQLAGQDLPEAQRKDWAYDFVGDEHERMGVYLTNTLEEAVKRSEILFARWIAEEGEAAAKIKRELPIMVLLGNPPYSVSSANKGDYIEGLMGRYKAAVRHEKNIQPLSDDYIKFIRFAHERVERTGYGIIGMITNHAYLSGLIHRGVREELIKTFDEIYVFNLHGSTLMGETAPDGSKDENVFDIRPGVAIALFVSKHERSKLASVKYCDLWGLRDEKYRYLLENDISTTEWRELKPQSPHFFFVDKDFDLLSEYEKGWPISEVLAKYSTGFVTGCDSQLIAYSRDEMVPVIRTLTEKQVPDEEIAERYGIKDTSGWPVSRRRQELITEGFQEEYLRLVNYRPFDRRYAYYHGFLQRARFENLKHLCKSNIALLTSRMIKGEEPKHVFVSIDPVEKIFLSPKTSNNAFVFPLYLYGKARIGQEQAFEGRRPNVDPDFVKDIEKRLGLTFISDGTGNLKKTFGPEDIFHYAYAVFHSPTYRERYAEFLKIDFPRLPLTSNKKLFAGLAEKGQELVALHLMESPALKDRITHYPVTGDHLVEKGHPKYFAPGDKPPGGTDPLTEGRVYISRDNRKTGKKGQHFEGVPPEVWEFHVGGYQVCNKWLKDRRGRILSYEDRVHYQKVVVALKETIRLMSEIDALIPAWPIV